MSYSTALNGKDETGVWLSTFQLRYKQVSTADHVETIFLTVHRRYHRTKCELYQV